MTFCFDYKQVHIIIWIIFHKLTYILTDNADECKQRMRCSPAPYANTDMCVGRSCYSHWFLECKSHFEDTTPILRVAKSETPT